MILIADSGSTKTDWCLISGNRKQHISTLGLNPQVQSQENIDEIISGEVRPQFQSAKIDQIWFYGAGTAFAENKEVLRKALNKSFSTENISIESDLVAAGRALLGNRKGVACILGTGSNSGLYENGQIVDKIPALGFILGDEGSGTHLGKIFLKNYLYGNCPDEVKKLANEKLGIEDISSVFQNVYKNQSPNLFLATIGGFVSDNGENPFFKQILREAFEDFFKFHIIPYPKDFLQVIGFIGSIGYNNSALIREIASKFEIRNIEFLKSPIDKLVNYHLILNPL